MATTYRNDGGGKLKFYNTMQFKWNFIPGNLNNFLTRGGNSSLPTPVELAVGWMKRKVCTRNWLDDGKS